MLHTTLSAQSTAADAVASLHLSGKHFVITGATGGLGLESARALASAGASLSLIGRNVHALARVAADLRAEHPEAKVDTWVMDQAHLAHVHDVAQRLQRAHPVIDGLLNNAGIMALGELHRTPDGFEMQLGTNHLGHFALTGLLLERVEAAGGRVVTVSSMAHAMGRFAPDDMMGERHYERWRQYGLTKLCNLLFHYELARRLAAKGSSAISVAAHPGYADTNLQYVGPQMDGSSLMETLTRIGNRWIAQSGEQGAEPQLRAALDPDARNGDFFGPDGWLQIRGHAIRVKPQKHAFNAAHQAMLWDWSVQTTGVDHPGLPAAAAVR